MRPVEPDVTDYLAFGDSALVEKVTYAKDQPQYLPLTVLRKRTPHVPVLSRWRLTDEERMLIATGADLYLELWTFGAPLQPIVLTIGQSPDVCPMSES